MQRLPAVAAHRFLCKMGAVSHLFNIFWAIVASLALLIPSLSSAQPSPSLMLAIAKVADAQQNEKLIARIEVNTPEELHSVLRKSERFFEEKGQLVVEPIQIVLHGAEVDALLRDNYKKFKPTVDLAAKLSAFRAIDVLVCETWMGFNGVTKDQLPPFVGTVEYGPAKKEKLLEQGYIYF